MTITVLALLVFVGITDAGEGDDNYNDGLERTMRRTKKMSEERIAEVINSPRRMSEIMVADSKKPYIPPTKFVWFKDNGMEAIEFDIKDTIFGEVLYDESDVMRKK